MKHTLTLFTALLLAPLALHAAGAPNQRPNIIPEGWDPLQAANRVMERLVKVTALQVKGAHDAEFVCVGDRAYIVASANDVQAGENAKWPFMYVTMSIVNLKTLKLEKVIDFAKGEQAFENEMLPVGAVSCRASCRRMPARCAVTSPAKPPASESRRCGIATSI